MQKVKFKKVVSLLAIVTLIANLMGITAFADDYSFDLSSAKPTYGGGQAFSTYTRLDNEKRDKYKFSPLWMSEDSTIEVDCTVDGDYEGDPLYFVFQSWSGTKVASQENKWVQIPPTSFDGSHATWTYDTITSVYGSTNFSDVYAMVIEDNGVNGVTISSLTITNVSVPKDEIANLSDGVVLRDGEIVVVDDAETAETEVTEVTETPEDSVSDEDEKVETETTSKDSDSSSDEKVESEDSEETTGSNTVLIVCIALGAALVIILTIIIARAIKKYHDGWH